MLDEPLPSSVRTAARRTRCMSNEDTCENFRVTFKAEHVEWVKENMSRWNRGIKRRPDGFVNKRVYQRSAPGVISRGSPVITLKSGKCEGCSTGCGKRNVS